MEYMTSARSDGVSGSVMLKALEHAALCVCLNQRAGAGEAVPWIGFTGNAADRQLCCVD